MEIIEKTLLICGADLSLNRVEMDVFVRGVDGEWVSVGRAAPLNFGNIKLRPDACFPATASLVETTPSRYLSSRPWLRSKKGRAAQ